MATGTPRPAGLAPASSPLLPRYEDSSLPNLATSILAALGVPGEPNPLRLPPAKRICLLVIDGLGWEALRGHQATAPLLAELSQMGRTVTAGFPSTTATSLASLGTGRPPGSHGMFGYQVAVPGSGTLLNALRWDAKVDPLSWQPGSTIFERAAAAGVSVSYVAPGTLRGSGLSVAALRGAAHRSANTLGALVTVTREALSEADRALVFAYYGDLDLTGHALGCESDAWRYQLAHVDKLAEQMASALPDGSRLYVTADHGMVDIPAEQRIDVDAMPGLREGVALLGGEPRARHVYARPGAAADVLAAWTELIGDDAWVLSRERVISEGWFGPVAPELSGRIGDVVAAAAGSAAIVATRAEPHESRLIGMHGSATAAEQLVPLLTLSNE
jgi:hypothetical protein